MALPGTYDFVGDNALYRGDKRADRHTFTDTDTGDPLDLSGRTWLAEIRATRDLGSDLLATLDVDDTDAATGVLVVTIPAAQTATVTATSAVWDLQATLVSDTTDVRTWLTGDVEFEGDVAQ